ncbi:MAG: luciferase family protein [Deltaproteobacteria bacterium]|jgi:probable F420-dependent oxidoreductase|nr:luciferase family protein [Deltaproteobacteria bacterium]
MIRGDTDRLQFGVSITVDRKRVREMSALPIDSMWVGGHVASPNGVQEVMVGLARLVELTDRIMIGSSILLLPLYPPAIVAKQVAELDRASGGRLALGVGIGGEYPMEFDACQVPVKERGARTNEAIPLLRRLWTGEEVTHEGRFYPMHNVRIFPAPHQDGGPPLIVAGRQPAAMRRAARLGDGWMPYLYSPRRYAESVATIQADAAQIGRELSGFHWTAFLFTAIDDDTDRALDKAAEFLGGTYRQNFREMVDRVAVAGDPDRLAQRLQEFVDAGARHLILTIADRVDPFGAARRVFAEVVPRLHIRPEGTN